ncbi:MAG: CU044_2847 family protein [Saprospiraceae bacterium]
MDNTKLIKLKDGTLVEVTDLSDRMQKISNKNAEKVEKGLEQIEPLFQRAIDSVVKNISWETDSLLIDQIEIELGMGFEAEGNIYVVKGKGSANFNVKFCIKPKPTSSEQNEI